MKEKMTSKLNEKYKEVSSKLFSDLGFTSVMQVPRIKKVVVNAGIGAIKDQKEALEGFVSDLAKITGQLPSRRKAKKSEAGFKIRKDEVVGLKVTLRGSRMWAFLDKFISIVLPRVRDFSGLDRKSIDHGGNLNIGISEHTLFPEVDQNNVKNIRGFEISIVTNSGNKEDSEKLFDALNVPFQKVAKSR